MNLPRDIARCAGIDWDPFGVMPECIDCARRLAGQQEDEESVVAWMEPPKKSPCPMRLEQQK